MKKLIAILAASLAIGNAIAFNPIRVGGGSYATGGFPDLSEESSEYPGFSVEYGRANKYNCIRHGIVRPCECTFCGADGKPSKLSGCRECIKERHDKNIQVLKKKKEKEQEKKHNSSYQSNSSFSQKTDYQQLARREREQFEYEKNFISDITLTNGSIVVYDRESLLMLLGIEFYPFEIVQVISDGKYLARSTFQYVDNSLYLLDYPGSDFVDDDKIKAPGYVSKAKYDYTTVNGANKRVRVFVAGKKAIDNLCPMIFNESIDICKVRIKENYNSNTYIEVTVVRNEVQGSRTIPSVDLWVDTLKDFRYFGVKHGLLVQIKEAPQ